jgi:hypothetical protein
MRKIQTAKSEADIRRVALPQATKEEVKKATCSCVNHLCGCE